MPSLELRKSSRIAIFGGFQKWGLPRSVPANYGRKEMTMLFKGIGRMFSTENDRQFETIGAFWDELAAKYGRVNLQGLGYGWTDRTIEYVIGLIDGEIDGADRTVKLPETGWITVRGRTADLGKIYETIYQEGKLKFEIERFTDSGDCEIIYCR